MNKATKNEVAVTADQLGRAMHYLGELGVDYVLIIDGVPTLFSNVKPRFALTICRDAVELQDQIREHRIMDQAERQSDCKLNPE